MTKALFSCLGLLLQTPPRQQFAGISKACWTGRAAVFLGRLKHRAGEPLRPNISGNKLFALCISLNETRKYFGNGAKASADERETL